MLIHDKSLDQNSFNVPENSETKGRYILNILNMENTMMVSLKFFESKDKNI